MWYSPNYYLVAFSPSNFFSSLMFKFFSLFLYYYAGVFLSLSFNLSLFSLFSSVKSLVNSRLHNTQEKKKKSSVTHMNLLPFLVAS